MREITKRIGWVHILVALLAVAVAVSAAAGEYGQEAGEGPYYEEDDWRSVEKRRKEILAKIPTHPDILINITYDLMPGTPELTALGRKATAALTHGLLDNASDSVRSLCVSVLAQIRDPESAPAMLEALGDRNSSVRMGAVHALGNLADPGYGKYLWKLVEDPEESRYVKQAAIDAIGNIGYAKATPKLEKLVTSKKDDSLAWDALNAMWHMRNKADRDDLVDVFLHVLKEEKSGASLAVDKLGTLKADEATGALAKYYVGRGQAEKNRVILAMGKIGSGKSRKFLKKVMKTTQVARHLNNAAIALSALDEKKQVMDILLDLLASRKAYMRINAAFALGEVGQGSDRAVQGLIKALEDQNDYVRSEAAVALGRLKATAAAGPLEKLAETSNPFVQLDAVVALNRIDYKKYRQLIFDKLLVHKKAKFSRIVERGIRFLAEQQDPDALPYLLAYLRSANPDRYGQTLQLLREYDKSGVGEFSPSLLYMAHTCRYDCFSELLRTVRKWKLAEFTSPLLERFYRTYYSGDKTLLYFTLGKIAGKDTAARLEKVVEKGHTVRLYRLFALANLGDAKALDELIDILVAGTLEDKRDAAFLLGGLDVKDAVPRLEALMEKSDDPFTAVAAASALLAQGEQKAIDYLYKTMSKGVPIVADEAERALLVAKMEDLDEFLKKSLKKEGNIVTKRRTEEILYRRKPKEFR